MIPPRSQTDDPDTAATESESDSGLTVVPSVSTESQADQDALAQTGAAQLLVMLGIIVSLGVLGATLIVARRKHA
ncbi:LPXTG cell wall anchor domain-containing protein [Gulosibacter chungangensis]|uniref:LPXTG cell wall anchor domain-containing protein n=1 Tax=Gulosibacter chungangensis TaxID=979746 RepID=A0A7J5BH50_9MICO|nr:LPXTG cell wall anchor domain-containing protein [Gulosibacter chungangensis]